MEDWNHKKFLITEMQPGSLVLFKAKGIISKWFLLGKIFTILSNVILKEVKAIVLWIIPTVSV